MLDLFGKKKKESGNHEHPFLDKVQCRCFYIWPKDKIDYIEIDGKTYSEIAPEELHKLREKAEEPRVTHTTVIEGDLGLKKKNRDLEDEIEKLQAMIKELQIEIKANRDTIMQYKKMYEGEKEKARKVADENKCLKKGLIFRKTNANEYTVDELLREEEINIKLRKDLNQTLKELKAAQNKIQQLQHQVQQYRTGYGLAEENECLKKELEETKVKCKEFAETARKRADLFIQSKKGVAGFRNYCPMCKKEGTLKQDRLYHTIRCCHCDANYTLNGFSDYTYHRLERLNK